MVIFIFVARRPLPSKETWAPETVFRRFSKNTAFFEKKLLKINIFNSLFVIKKSYVNFWRKTLPFSKKLSNAPPKNFFTFFSENTVCF